MTVQKFAAELLRGPAEGIGVLTEGFFGVGWKPASYMGSEKSGANGTFYHKKMETDKRFAIDRFSKGDVIIDKVPTPQPIPTPTPTPSNGGQQGSADRRQRQRWGGSGLIGL